MSDNVHGTAHFIVSFRNRFAGFEQGKYAQTVPIHIYAANRYFSVIGNVLGTDSYHTNYSAQAPGSSANCDKSIYSLGWGGNCGGGLPNDPLVASTPMRWGLRRSTTRWMASEYRAHQVYECGTRIKPCRRRSIHCQAGLLRQCRLACRSARMSPAAARQRVATT
jgi:hypothetical protein